MRCPNCGRELTTMMAKKGAEIHFCEKCHGVWLDKGAIFNFTGKPRLVSGKLDEAISRRSPGRKPSPRTGNPMSEIKYPDGPTFDYCPETGGLWFDSSEVEELLQAEKEIEADFRESPVGLSSGPGVPGGSDTAAQSQASRRPLRNPATAVLPGLVSRTVFTLLGLYALLAAALIASVEFLDVPLEAAVLAGIVGSVLQFLAGPYLMDFSLGLMYNVEWTGFDKLPEHLREFVSRVCRSQGMKHPRFGIIRDGAPQAFTYGHTPSNARIVLSSGMFDLLKKEELESVVAHELGHAAHWDMFLMTVAQLVPLLLYYIYKILIRAGSRSKKGNALGLVGVGAFVLYIISEYVVLWFSRTREYHADRFAGKATGDPSLLASALVKIAYGLAGKRKAAPKEKGAEKKPEEVGLSAVGALGIFDAKAAIGMAVASYAAVRGGGQSDQAGAAAAMRWDLWNPWAKWYELNSTHPLVANRLRYLSDQAISLGKEPYVVFDEMRPESYWDEFLSDFLVHVLPYVAGGVLLAGHYVVELRLAEINHRLLYGGGFLALGLSVLLRIAYSYRGGFFAPMSVSSLLGRVKVSATRPVPCTLKGKIIGRGVPGYILSEDFVLQDETGIIFLDYRHPLRIWEMLFGLLKAEEYQGKTVVVEGWYRRAPVPYVEISRLISEGKTRKCWVLHLYVLTASALVVTGVLMALKS